jgi:hypothetical protein
MNSVIQDSSTAKIEYISFNDLEDFGDIDFELLVKECYNSLEENNADWIQQYNGLNTLRRLNKFEAKVFDAIFEKLVYNVAKLAISLRTNIAKIVLILFTEIFYTHNYNIKILRQIIPAILVQSAHLKQFIKEEAGKALSSLSKCKSNTFEIIQLLSEGVTNKNPTISENSLNTLLNFINNCNLYDIQNDEWLELFKSVTQIYSLKKEIYTKKACKLLSLYIEVLEDSFGSVVKRLSSDKQYIIESIKSEINAKNNKISSNNSSKQGFFKTK